MQGLLENIHLLDQIGVPEYSLTMASDRAWARPVCRAPAGMTNEQLHWFWFHGDSHVCILVGL